MTERALSGSGTEGPGGHEARPPIDDTKVPARVFLFIGLAVALLAVVYWAAAYEEGGTVMLVLAAGLAVWIATYLWLRQRRPAGPVGPTIEPPHPAAPERYLPHASAWPFAIGLGAATVANGLVLGVWLIVPGVALMVLGIGGFVRQTRRRD